MKQMSSFGKYRGFWVYISPIIVFNTPLQPGNDLRQLVQQLHGVSADLKCIRRDTVF